MALASRWFHKRSKASDGALSLSVDDKQRSTDLFVYEALLIRELEKDNLLWQAPALALTAQAFLLTIALDAGSTRVAVLLSAFLGLVVAGLSLQLMAKHRFLMLLDRADMHLLEERLDIPHVSSRAHFFSNRKYAVPLTLQGRGAPRRVGFLASAKSFRWWSVGLVLFLAVNFLIMVLEVAGIQY